MIMDSGEPSSSHELPRLAREWYHVKDDGTLHRVGYGSRSTWEQQNVPTCVYEDFVIWRCAVCKRLIQSDVSVEYSFRLVEKVIANATNNRR